jgi:HK97 family phage major capsid protein
MMTRQERVDRVAELRRWIQEQHEEFRDDSFPADVQEQWENNDAELRDHERVLAELEARDARILEVAQDPAAREGGADLGALRSRPRATPVVRNMSESEVYDLSSVRFNPLNPTAASGEMVDRAMRAVELAHFPTAGRDQERARGHIQGLLRRSSDDESIVVGDVARRILTTGSPAYRRAFTKMLAASMRGAAGFANLTPEESRAVEATRALSVGTGSAGGFAVPYNLDPTVIPTSNLSVNPFRAVCRTEQITVNEWRGVTTAGVTAAYAVEGTEASDNSPTLAQPSMFMQRAQCFVPVSIELTQDWGAIQAELAMLIQDAKDDLEATKFTTGTGTNEPTGLITGATTTVTGGGGAATFVIADLYALEQSLGPRFRPRAVVLGNRFAFNKIRQFDTAGGSGVWGLGPSEGMLSYGLASQVPQGGNIGQQVISYPAYEDSAMAAALTTGSKILVIGDPRYYLIVDRIGMDIEIIPHLFGATNRFPTGQRGFYAYWRNNATVLSANAFRVLVTA